MYKKALTPDKRILGINKLGDNLCSSWWKCIAYDTGSIRLYPSTSADFSRSSGSSLCPMKSGCGPLSNLSLHSSLTLRSTELGCSTYFLFWNSSLIPLASEALVLYFQSSNIFTGNLWYFLCHDCLETQLYLAFILFFIWGGKYLTYVASRHMLTLTESKDFSTNWWK